MKVGIPPVGSVSPCVRMFVESLIREVEDASIPWVFEPEGADLNPSAIAAVEEIRVANRERSSQPTS